MGIKNKAKEIAKIIEKQEEIKIIAHCDADGITGASIAKKVLDESGIKNKVEIVRYLDRKNFSGFDGFTWLIDIGNGIKSSKENFVVTDHHFSIEYYKYALNPFNFGIDGEYEISASGLTYLVASNIMPIEADIAIIGAIGDLQDLRFGKLVGMNRELLKNSGIEIKKDLRIYGRGKPLQKMIAYSNDPIIPGIFRRERNAAGFLKRIGIDYKKSWMECSKEEKRRILSSLIKLMIEKGFSYDYINRLFGEVYEMNGTDVREYSTLLNSIGKYGDGKRAIEMCINGKFNAEEIIEEHRRRISKYIKYAKTKLDEYGDIYYFHGDGYIMDTLLGTIAGMVLKEGNFPSPVLAFTENSEGIKVSARAPYMLVERGINLSLAVKNAALLTGGDGGGHKIAAGAIIPRGMEERFLQIFNSEIKNQLNL
ncbi:MAG TPA: DHH family phosphoesterase [Thermoplasmatales archaeon]|nr:DHH family phosphoesterase [Thermoplasmatales archaeon]